MKTFAWNLEKNEHLITDRGISFERIVHRIENEGLMDVLEHPNQGKYPGQRVLVVECEEYAYLVPYVENDTEYFLKTIIPSRKATKKYLGESS